MTEKSVPDDKSDEELANAVRKAARDLNRAADTAVEAGLEVDIRIAEADEPRALVKRGDVVVWIARPV